MEIEIITTNNSIPTTSIPIENTTVQATEQNTNVEGIKQPTDIEIDNITNKVLGDILEYFSKETELEHMRDEIINQRICAITKEKYHNHIKQTIINLIKLLHENSDINEYIEFCGKLTYGIDDVIDEIIYEYIFNETSFIIDITKYWLRYEDNIGHDILINSIIKNVFQILGDKFEYTPNTNNEEAENEEENNEEYNEEEENEDDEEPEEDDEEAENEEIQCVIS